MSEQLHVLIEVSYSCSHCEDLNNKLSPVVQKQISHCIMVFMAKYLFGCQFPADVVPQAWNENRVCPPSTACTGHGWSCCCLCRIPAHVAPGSQSTRTESLLQRPDVFILFLAVGCFSFTGWSNSDADFPSLQVCI